MTNDKYDNIYEYLGKQKNKDYLYTGIFAKEYVRNKVVNIISFCPNNGATCEALLQLKCGIGGQVEWIPRNEIINNLMEVV